MIYGLFPVQTVQEGFSVNAYWGLYPTVVTCIFVNIFFRKCLIAHSTSHNFSLLGNKEEIWRYSGQKSVV